MNTCAHVALSSSPSPGSQPMEWRCLHLQCVCPPHLPNLGNLSHRCPKIVCRVILDHTKLSIKSHPHTLHSELRKGDVSGVPVSGPCCGAASAQAGPPAGDLWRVTPESVYTSLLIHLRVKAGEDSSTFSFVM